MSISQIKIKFALSIPRWGRVTGKPLAVSDRGALTPPNFCVSILFSAVHTEGSASSFTERGKREEESFLIIRITMKRMIFHL